MRPCKGVSAHTSLSLQVSVWVYVIFGGEIRFARRPLLPVLVHVLPVLDLAHLINGGGCSKVLVRVVVLLVRVLTAV